MQQPLSYVEGERKAVTYAKPGITNVDVRAWQFLLATWKQKQYHIYRQDRG